MSGLASRWATDETLVKQAIEQDSKQLHHPRHNNSNDKPGSDLEDSKWSKPITSKKSETLVSIWADAEDTQNVYPSPPLSKDDYGKHRGKSDSQHNHHKRRDNVSPRKSKNNHEGTPRVRRNSQPKQGNEDDERGPMTAAARAFAARFDKPADKQDYTRSSGANSLAERLDKLSVGKHTTRERKSNHKPHNTASVKLETLKHKHVDTSEEDKQKEEKEKQELLKMLEELESQQLDWASME